MRVLLLSDFGVVNGGAAKVAITSALALAEAGARVCFVYGGGSLDPRLVSAGVETIGLGLESVWEQSPVCGLRNGVWNATALRRLRDVLAGVGGDAPVVHVHQWTKTLSPSVLALLRRQGLRTVLTMHDYFAICPNGAYYRYRENRPCDLRPLSRACLLANCDRRSYGHKLVRLLRQAPTRAALGGHPALDLVHVSRFAFETARPFLPQGSRNFVVRNPVPVGLEPPVPVRNNRRVVFLGRFTPEKGAVAAATAARTAGLPITFMGDGPEKGAIRAANPGAELLPWGDEAEVAALLRSARALVMPSLWYETSGLVVAEAAARGVPAIVADTVGAYRDLGLEPDRSVLTFASGNAEGLMRALATVADDDRAEALGANCYAAFWRAPPTPATHAADLMALYTGRAQPVEAGC